MVMVTLDRIMHMKKFKHEDRVFTGMRPKAVDSWAGKVGNSRVM